MNYHDVIQIALFVLALFIAAPLLGRYMASVFEGQIPSSLRFLKRMEIDTYRLIGVDSTQEMNWTTYAKSLLIFNGLGLVVLWALLMLQGILPLNPQDFKNPNWTEAFNTAASFVTNTNWQSYSGENTLSYLSQAFGLTVQNFLSAATGNAVLLALIRGIKRKSTSFIGNFWVDLIRTVIYVLLPLSFILALMLVSQGVIQNFAPYHTTTTLEGATQVLPGGPVASQEAIKQLGTNGGGFFGANSAHPFENPTPLSNFLEMFAILCLPAALTYTYGLLIGSRKQGIIIFSVMFIFWILALAIALYAEWSPNLVLGHSPVLEGKETRIGVTNSVLWAVSTTSTSNGSVNAMIDSLSPLAGGMALFQMLLGEVVFGGVGTGLCVMVMYILLTVFLAGLMVGRTPEYLGKKIEKNEIQWAMIALVVPVALVLVGTSIALLLPSALASLKNTGPHGFSEMLYAFASAAGTNGSAFAGLNAQTPFFNLMLGSIMILSRLAILIPSLAIAGSLANKKMTVESLGTLRTDTALFGTLLACIILVFAALTFFPALSLGPIAEHLLMQKGQAF